MPAFTTLPVDPLTGAIGRRPSGAPLYHRNSQFGPPERDCREIGGHAAMAAGGCGSLAAWKRRPVISPPPHTPNL
jgi:hypothetical protein